MLREALGERLKTAMRAKDAPTVSAIRMIMAGLKDRDIAARGGEHAGTIPDSEILRMLQGMMKQRRESIAMYQQGNRPELAEKESREREILLRYLPAQKSPDEIRAVVRAALAGLPEGGRNQGALMKLVLPQLKGLADGNAVRKIVTEELASA